MKQLLQNLAFALLCVNLTPHVARAQGPTLDPSFAPTVAVPGASQSSSIIDVVRQPDGKLIIAGNFSQINAVPAPFICRLLPNGQVDASFAAVFINSIVRSVVLQSDGKLIIGGAFDTVDGQPRNGVARLLPNGALDVGFVPALLRSPVGTGSVLKVAVQPGAGILVAGFLASSAATTTPDACVVRLNAITGALDSGFQPVPYPGPRVFDILVQPNGRLIFAGDSRLIGSQRCTVWGTLSNGAPDPAFVPLPDTTIVRALARDPATGNLYVGADDANGVLGGPLRLLPNGTPDPTFNTSGSFGTGGPQGLGIRSMAVQPNGRLLLGGGFYDGSNTYGTWRLLPNGTRDLSYQPGNGPVARSSGVNKVLVQPDGALVFCGLFDRVGSSRRDGLARMLDPNVLTISKQQAEASLAAWPVPAHDALHLRLAPGPGPLRVTLLDALGRTVRQQAVAAGQAALTLPLAGLPPGAYLLRVAYPSGPVLRRVAVE